MTLLELSAEYARSEALLQSRVTLLRTQLRSAPDQETAHRLQRRIAALDPLLREMRVLSQLTAHYYERSYHRHEHYTL